MSLVSKPYGSIYKVNLARNVFELRKECEGDVDRTELLLVHTKANSSARLPTQGRFSELIGMWEGTQSPARALRRHSKILC